AEASGTARWPACPAPRASTAASTTPRHPDAEASGSTGSGASAPRPPLPVPRCRATASSLTTLLYVPSRVHPRRCAVLKPVRVEHPPLRPLLIRVAVVDADQLVLVEPHD